MQRNAMRAWQEQRPFRELIEQEPVVREHLTQQELDALSLIHISQQVSVAVVAQW